MITGRYRKAWGLELWDSQRFFKIRASAALQHQLVSLIWHLPDERKKLLVRKNGCEWIILDQICVYRWAYLPQIGVRNTKMGVFNPFVSCRSRRTLIHWYGGSWGPGCRRRPSRKEPMRLCTAWEWRASKVGRATAVNDLVTNRGGLTIHRGCFMKGTWRQG